MAKKRGIPDSFEIAVADGSLEPVDLDDFIDENIPSPGREKPKPVAPPLAPERESGTTKGEISSVGEGGPCAHRYGVSEPPGCSSGAREGLG